MSQFGPIRAYYADLVSGAIRPEDVRIESLPYRATFDAAGQPVTTSPTRSIISRYNFILRKVYAWIANPGVSGYAPALITFQAREEGRGFDVFKFPQTLASYVGTSGPCDHEWDGCYITVAGTDLAVNWGADTVNWLLLVGAARICGVDLVGDYVNCGQPPAPTGG